MRPPKGCPRITAFLAGTPLAHIEFDKKVHSLDYKTGGKMTDIVIVDLHRRGRFTHSRRLVSALLHAHDVKGQPVPATYEVLASGSRSRVAKRMEEPIGLLHLMSHGQPDGQLQGKTLTRRTTDYAVDDVKNWLDQYDLTLNIDAVLLDACSTFTKEWKAGISSLIAPGQSAVMIGSVGKVDFHEAQEYVAAFYTALLSRPFPVRSTYVRKAVLNAHDKAVTSYKLLTGRRSKFRAVELRSDK